MRKKKIRHKNKALKKVVISLSFLVLFTVLVWSFIQVLIFFIRKPVIISPLAAGKTSSIRRNIDSLLLEKHILFSSINTASDSSYVVSLSGGGEVVLSPKKDLLFQISSLQFILKRLTIEGKRLKSLDFRYDKPILVF